METRLPVFVYGTLRNGQGNYRLLRGRTEAEYPAVLPGHALLAAGLPFAIPEKGYAVRGDLMVVREDAWPETLRDLDRLEGFRPEAPEGSLYVRTRRTPIYFDEGAQHATEAWVYLAGRVLRPDAEATIVTDGDWVRWSTDAA